MIELDDVDNEMISEIVSQIPQVQTLFIRALKEHNTPDKMQYKPIVQVRLVPVIALQEEEVS